MFLQRTGDRSSAPTLTPLTESSILRTSGKARRRSRQYFLCVGQSRCWHDMPQYLASYKRRILIDTYVTFITLLLFSYDICKPDVYLASTTDGKLSKFFFNPCTWRIPTFIVGVRVVLFLNNFSITVVISHYCRFRIALFH